MTKIKQKKQRKQRGGFEGISYDAGGTSGWPWTLAEDIILFINYIFIECNTEDAESAEGLGI